MTVSAEFSRPSVGGDFEGLRRHVANCAYVLSGTWTIIENGGREGIEHPTRGFSGVSRGYQGFINQSLAASCRPLPRHTTAQLRHTQSELVTYVAQRFGAMS